MKKNTFLFLTCLMFTGVYIQAQQFTNERIHERGSMQNMPMTHLRSFAPPVQPIRSIAEFEPTEAVIIAYNCPVDNNKKGFGIPLSLIKDLADNVNVIIIGAGDGSSVKASLQSAGVNMTKCQFLDVPNSSWWTRDYTGWFIADGNNKIGLIDFKFSLGWANDDAMAPKEAAQLNVPCYSMDLVLTGGNYMTDGMGTSHSTVLLSDDNNGLSKAQIDQRMKEYLGITNNVILPDAQGEWLKHIDCWAKFLSVDKVLVDSVPKSDARYQNYEDAATYYTNTNCSYGYKYKVYRAYISGSKTSDPYANSFICNDKVYLPFNGNSYDAAALNVYKKALPGYTIKTYLAANGAPWLPIDALHCRVHEIPDRNMLYVSHMPLFGKQCSTTGYKVNVGVVSYGGQSLKSGYPRIIYKVNGGPWDSISMISAGINKYEATIPAQVNGSKVAYFIRAIDITGKLANHPFIGAPDPHNFIADCASGINNMVENVTYINTYPNPNQGNFYVYIDNVSNTSKATLKVINSIGKVVYNESYNLKNGVNLKTINLGNTSKGVYFIEFRNEFESINQKMIIQ
jgi:agmatine deiminase